MSPDPNPDARSHPNADATGLPPSHLRPRSREGRVTTILWAAVFLLCMPPVTHALLDRPDLWVGGVPFFFVALLAVYSGLIAVLVWALRRGL